MNDVIINKIESIQRCIKRAREEYEKAGKSYYEDYTRQDAAILNITRACEQTIDLANHDFDYYMLMTNGINGEHWELNDQGHMVMPEGVSPAETGFAWDAPCPWGWREEKFHLGGILQNPNTMPVIKQWWTAWADNSIFNTAIDFAFDPTPEPAPTFTEFSKSYSIGQYENTTRTLQSNR